VVVALRAPELRAEEHAADGDRRLFGLVAELHLEQLGAGLLAEQHLAGDAVESGAVGELLREPRLEPVALAGRVGVARVPAEQHLVPDVGLLPGEPRVGEEGVDQLLALRRARVGEERDRLVVCRNGADEVERDAAEELGVGRPRGRGDAGLLPAGL
jgi:hypothetical protein